MNTITLYFVCYYITAIILINKIMTHNLLPVLDIKFTLSTSLITTVSRNYKQTNKHTHAHTYRVSIINVKLKFYIT